MLGCILVLIIHHSVTKTIKPPRPNSGLREEKMLYIALGFPKGNRVTDHYSILVPKVVGFPPRFAATMSSMKVLNKWRNLVSLVYSVFLVLARNIICTNRKFVTINVRSTLLKKTEFCKNVKLACSL